MDLFAKDEQKAIDFIKASKNSYAVKRELHTIEELVYQEYGNIFRDR